MRILILNIYSRNALAVVNSLDPAYTLFGADIAVGRFRLINPDGWFRSARLRAVFRHRDPVADLDGFAEDLVTICNEQAIDAVIPAGDQIIRHVAAVKDRVAPRVDAKILVDDNDKFLKISDKWFVVETCRRAGVPTPTSVLVDPDADWQGQTAELPYPVVIKPRNSHASKGVAFFDRPQDLAQYIDALPPEELRDHQGRPLMMVQQAIEGELHDVALIAKHGRAFRAFSQKRLRGLYDFGGGGIVNITTDEPTILDYAKTITEQVGWNGICEFDFIRTSEGRFYLLECNPRIWGTTQLSTEAGVNVVQQLIEVFVLDREPIQDFNYTKGLLYRWWFPEIFYHWVHLPVTPSRLATRLKATLGRHGAARVKGNLEVRNLRHFLGLVFNRLGVR